MKPSQTTVRASRNQYLKWLDKSWWRIRGWNEGFRNMVLWYSVAGAAVMSEGAADSILDKAIKGKKLPGTRAETWRQAKAISCLVCDDKKTNPIDWFTGNCGCVFSAWQSLDDVKNIGPKIASWLMRDLGLMRDYSDGSGGKQVCLLPKPDRSWYEKLPEECQALFVPIDVWVHKGARICGIGGLIKKHDANKIQLDPDLHVDASTEIVRWARKNGYDPRDLDIFWYLNGSGKAD